MAVYDDQTKGEKDELKKIDDITGGDSGKPPSTTKNGSSDEEKSKLGLDKDKDSNNNSFSAKLKNKLSIKRNAKKYTTGLLATLVGTAVASLIFLAPLFIVRHIGEMLKNIGNVQISHQLKYRRKMMGKIKNIFSADSRRGKAILKEMAKKGYVAKIVGGKIEHFTKPLPKGVAGPVMQLPPADTIHDFIEKQHPLRTSRWKTKRMNSFYKKFGVPRKSLLLKGSIDLNDSVRMQMNKNLFNQIDEDPIDMEQEHTRDTSSGENPPTEEEIEKTKEKVRSSEAYDDIKKKLKNGTPIKDLTKDERALLRIGLEFDEELAEILDKIFNSSLKDRLMKGFVSLAAGGIDLADAVCRIKDAIKAGMLAARIYRSKALLKYGAAFISASDQTSIGDIDNSALNDLMKRVVSKDGKGRPFGGSQGIKSMIDGRFNKKTNEVLRDNYANDGTPTGISGTFWSLTNGMGGCSVFTNPFAQIGIGVVFTVITFSTGGLFKGGQKALEQGAKMTLGELFKKHWKRVMGQTALQGTIQISLGFLVYYLKAKTEKIMTIPATGQETGGDLGDLLASGGGVLSTRRGLRAGQVPATVTQYSQALEQYKQDKAEQIKGQSFYARIFDYNNPDSMMFKTASMAMAADWSNSIVNIPGNLIKSIASLSPSVSAASEDEFIEFDSYTPEGTNYNLAVDFSGNLLTVMTESTLNIDPEENIEYLIRKNLIESKEPYEPINEFRGHVNTCVDNEDLYTILEEMDKKMMRTSDVKDLSMFDCLARLNLAKRYKAHLAYMDMADTVDATLFPGEVGEGGDSRSIHGAGDEIAGDPYSGSSGVACASGTTDLGIFTASANGSEVQMRICRLDNLPSSGNASTPGNEYYVENSNNKAMVNSRVSGAWKNLVDAAKADGITLTASSSFRSEAEQIALQGGSTVAAAVGFSGHQAGTAIDFAGVGGAEIKGATCASGRATGTTDI